MADPSKPAPGPLTDGPLSMRAGRTILGQPRTRQYFDWGHVFWLVEPKSQDGGRISVGEVTFYPNRGEPEHSHFGEEQVLYIISGHGFHTVNGLTTPLRQGEAFYIPPYSTHTLTNNSDNEDLHLLAFYSTSRFKPSLIAEEDRPAPVDEEVNLASVIDFDLTGRLLNNLSQALKLSLRLLDPSGKILIASGYQPRLCRESDHDGHCLRHIREMLGSVGEIDSPRFTFCCGRVSSLIIPVVCGQTLCGYVKCGEFFIGPDDRQDMREHLARETGCDHERTDKLLEGILIEKKSRLHSAAEATSAVAAYVAETGLSMMRQKELDENRLSVIQGQIVSANLEKALRESDFKLLQSQINPHFLFNTLNIISQMAYMEGADQAASLVCSLAELMRATLRKANLLIPLSEETALLQSYLHIQKTRFGQRLEAEVIVEPGLDQVKMPILILQPLVENAIVHGMERKRDGCRLKVEIKRNGRGSVVMTVADDGPGFDPAETSDSGGLGLKSIRARLRHFFDDHCSMEIGRSVWGGGLITITIPDSAVEG